MRRVGGPKLFPVLVLVGAALSCAVVLVVVGGLPGVLYAGGIVMLAILLFMRGRRSARSAADDAAPAPGWGRKSRLIGELQAELAAADAHAAELDHVVTGLRRQLADEQANGRELQASYQSRVQELESALQHARYALSSERLRIDRLLERLGSDLARHGEELTTIDQRLEQLAGIPG